MNQPSSPFTWQQEFGALVGIDWADEQHHFCLGEVASGEKEAGLLTQTPEAIDEWVSSLRQRFGPKPVAIALEQSKGALTNCLTKYDFIVLYPVDGKKLKAYRESYISSGASNDPTDAELLWEYLYTRGEKMKAIRPDTPEARLLAMLVERRREVVDDRTRLTNKLQAALKRFYPQALKLVGEELSCPMTLEFLSRWPTLGALQRARPATIRDFYTTHGCRSEQSLVERLEVVNRAVALTEDPAIVEDGVMLLERLVHELRVLNEALGKYEARIAELLKHHEDAAIYASVPGAGKAMEPRLAAVLGTDRTRWDSEREILTLHGVAPVTERSGKTKHFVRFRWACHTFSRQTWVEFADHSRKQCAWAKAFYLMKKEKGIGHHAILRALAYKWVRILFRCWKSRTPYDEAKYLESLRKHGSPIIAFMEKNNIMA
jgi:transposase